MKKVIVLIIGTFLLVSCVKSPYSDPSTEDPKITERLTPYVKFVVPVQTGYTSIVTIGSDTLCIATEETEIWIPKNAVVINGEVATKAESTVQVSYHEGINPNAGTSQMWQTIGFEDSEDCDYDYNDLVIHCKYMIRNNQFGIGVHPIALGSTKIISLGCIIYVKGEVAFEGLLCDNCRSALFNDQAGFINTGQNANFHTNFFKISKVIDIDSTVRQADIIVVWFIVAGEKTLYAVNDKYGYLNSEQRPYGIIVTNTGNTFYQDEKNPNVGGNWFAFPYESISINIAYPTFNDWVDGKIEACDFTSATPSTTIDLDTYCFDRPDVGLTRIYYISTSKTPW